MSKEDISLERLLKICNWLGISLTDVSAAADSQSFKANHLTLEQEEYFAAFPKYFTYLRYLARGYTPSQIEEIFCLSDAKTDKYLLELEQLEIISRNPNIKLIIPWPIQFRFPGPLQKKFFNKIQSYLVKRLSMIELNQENTALPTFYFADSLLLLPESYRKYREEIQKLYEKWTMIGRSEMRLSNPTELIPATSLLGIGAFDAITEAMGKP
ncbi:MAG: hypothetical protein R3B45_10940 [Bdellovibrionota bacterium]